MQGTLIVNKINVRLLPSVNSADVGDLWLNEKVYGEVKNGWIKFDRVYKTNGVIDDATKGYAAIWNPSIPSELFMKLEDVPEPSPLPDESEPTVKPLTVTIGGDDYETVTITLNPKA